MGESEEDLGVEVDGEEDTEGEVDMEGEGGEVDESKMLRPGVFVWCLTLCAGVSGLWRAEAQCGGCGGRCGG